MSETLHRSQPIAVFDSGVGGLSVLKALVELLPGEHFSFLADERYLPYGDKPQHEITARVLTLSNWLKQQGNKALVIACNTATAAGATQVRLQHPGWPIVGIEPAVKPATMMSKTGVVGILATTNTVASERFRSLVERFDPLAKVIAKPCPGLVELIEQAPLNEVAVEGLLRPTVEELVREGADVIVLGCTHYPFVAHVVSRLAGDSVAVIETGLPVARQLRARLEQEALMNVDLGEIDRIDATARVHFYTTGAPEQFKAKLVSLMGSAWANVKVCHAPV